MGAFSARFKNGAAPAAICPPPLKPISVIGMVQKLGF